MSGEFPLTVKVNSRSPFSHHDMASVGGSMAWSGCASFLFVDRTSRLLPVRSTRCSHHDCDVPLDSREASWSANMPFS